MVGTNPELLTIPLWVREVPWSDFLNMDLGGRLFAWPPLLFNYADQMLSVEGLIAALAPAAIVRAAESVRRPLPNPLPPDPSTPSHSIPHSADFTADIGHSGSDRTPSQSTPTPSETLPTPSQPNPETGCVAARLVTGDGQRLLFVADLSRPAPSTVENAVDQFVGLMSDAVLRRLMPAKFPIADLRRFYDGIAGEFEWPEISTKRLSMLLEDKGCQKTEHRSRKGGKEKRGVAFIIPEKQARGKTA